MTTNSNAPARPLSARGKPTSRRIAVIGWIMVLPAVLIRAFTTVYPTISTFVYSLFDYSKLYNTMKFIGLGNFIRVFRDPKVIVSIQFTLMFTVCSVALHVVLGILLALLLNGKFAGKRYIRTVALIPWAMPMIVAGIAASWAFNDMYGIVNDLIRRVAPDYHIDWLVSVPGARASVIMVDLWKSLPFFAILVLAALQSIPEEIYESARIDGAGTVRSFFSVTWPGIRQVVLTMVIFITLWRMTSFDVVYTMTKGGPGNATAMLAYRIYEEAFRTLNFGYAASINVILFVLMSLFGIGALAILRKADWEGKA